MPINTNFGFHDYNFLRRYAMFVLNLISLIILTTYTGATYVLLHRICHNRVLPQQDKVVSGGVTFTTTAGKMTIKQETQ